MSGYRDSRLRSQCRRRLRPSTAAVQLGAVDGVASLFVGAAIMLAYLGGRIGLYRRLLDSPTPGPRSC